MEDISSKERDSLKRELTDNDCFGVTTDLCERSFSALRRIKTWVRNSMSNKKLGSIDILTTEHERAQSLDNDRVIDAFAAMHKTDALNYTLCSMVVGMFIYELLCFIQNNYGKIPKMSC